MSHTNTHSRNEITYSMYANSFKKAGKTVNDIEHKKITENSSDIIIIDPYENDLYKSFTKGRFEELEPVYEGNEASIINPISSSRYSSRDNNKSESFIKSIKQNVLKDLESSKKETLISVSQNQFTLHSHNDQFVNTKIEKTSNIKIAEITNENESQSTQKKDEEIFKACLDSKIPEKESNPVTSYFKRNDANLYEEKNERRRQPSPISNNDNHNLSLEESKDKSFHFQNQGNNNMDAKGKTIDKTVRSHSKKSNSNFIKIANFYNEMNNLNMSSNENLNTSDLISFRENTNRKKEKPKSVKKVTKVILPDQLHYESSGDGVAFPKKDKSFVHDQRGALINEVNTIELI